jgi:hypothetical protein
MRRIIATILFVVGGVSSLGQTYIEFRKVGAGGTRHWVGGDLAPCLQPGTTCSVKIVRPNGSAEGNVTPYGTGFLVEGLIQNVRHTLVADTNTWNEFTGANALLDSTMTMRVISSDEYPALNGREVNLQGAAANSSGVVTVYFP